MEASNGSFDLWLVNPDGSNLYRITSYKEIAKIKDWKNGGALYPDWSYSGREIVFYSRTMKDSKISAINPDGSGYRDLSID
jgi:Tol biopolymer transport system component